MITEEEKKCIREEEIYRAEIRHEIELKNKQTMWSFVNSAFGIWVLSTLVVGFLSLSFAQWKEHQDRAEVNRKAIQNILEEGHFRVRQLDLSMSNTFRSLIPILGKISSNKKSIKKQKVNKFLQEVLILSAVVQHGGVSHVPPLTQKELQIARNVVKIRDLPFSKSYKYPEYQYYSLFDLIKRMYKFRNNKSTPAKLADNLLADFEELIELSRLDEVEHTFRKWSEESNDIKNSEIEVDYLKKDILKFQSWLAHIKQHLDDNYRYKKEVEVFNIF